LIILSCVRNLSGFKIVNHHYKLIEDLFEMAYILKMPVNCTDFCALMQYLFY
jgi:hypothetical protein